MYAKQNIMSFSIILILFQSTAHSGCPITIFIAPVTMSQIGHVFGDLFSLNIDKWNITNMYNNFVKYYLFIATDTWKS